MLRIVTSMAASFDQGAAALRQGSECLIARDRRDNAIKIPWFFGFCRLLHLDKIHVVEAASVFPDPDTFFQSASFTAKLFICLTTTSPSSDFAASIDLRKCVASVYTAA
jgi:hypothetical protein